MRLRIAFVTHPRALVARVPSPTSPSPFMVALAAGAGLRLLAMLGYPLPVGAGVLVRRVLRDQAAGH